jgi:hypothetical protein
MADNNPNALDAQAAAPPPAPTTPEPTPAPATPAPAASGGLWASMTGKQKLLVMAGGSVVAAVGAMYGAKQFSPMPPRAVAQELPVVSPAEPERKPETAPAPDKEKDDDIVVPPVGPAPVPQPGDGGPIIKPVEAPKFDRDGKPILNENPGVKAPDLDIGPPPLPPPGRELETDTKATKDVRPGSGAPDIAPPPTPGPLPSDINIPEIKAPAGPVKKEREYTAPPAPGGDKWTLPDVPPTPGEKNPGTGGPVITIPGTRTGPPTPGPKPAASGEDTFKPVDVPPNPRARPTGVVPVGGTDTPTPPEKKAGDPAGLKLDLDTPPAPPSPKKDGGPGAPKLDLDPLPPPVPMGSAPTIPPVPGLGEKDPAPLPATPMLPEVKTPEVKLPEGPPGIALPKIDVGPAPMTPPTIDVRPAPAGPMTPPIERGGPAPLPPVGVGAPPEPAKKDSYEEDWHTPDNVSTYVGISNFYYKTPDYAKALEAYNRDRQKPGERIVRVPPTWVLDEKFPSLTGKDPKAGAATPGGLTFDKVEPAGATRPAPAPAVAAGSADEYKVTAETGEKIKDIARKVYGDANAWRKLTDLNPNLDPTEPIPAGTTLRVGK